MGLPDVRHIGALESLRFIFIFLIFVSHFSWNGSGFWDAGGDCGVSFFFILSGFVLSLSGRTLSGGYGDYMLRRMKRVYPVHLLALLLAFVCVPWCFDMLNTVLSLLLLQSWVPWKDVYFGANAVSWFLSDLVLCYIAFPWLKRGVFGMRGMVLLAAVMAVAALYVMVVPMVPADRVNWLLYVFPPLRMIDFCLGICTARLFMWIHSKGAAMSAVCATAVEISAIALLCAAFAVYRYVPEGYATASLFWLPCAGVILAFAVGDFSSGVAGRILRWRVLLWLGAISFEFYLVHVSVIGLLGRVCRHYCVDLPWGCAFLTAFTLSVAVAWGLKRLVGIVSPRHD
ncbi:MAG: acyltransferase [Lachnospiraceae bacterium]|nr:acyltransferase [Lachnospiraceae bacterium]